MPRWGLIVYNKRISTTLSDFTHHNPASLSWRTFLCRSAVQLVAAMHFLRSLVVAHSAVLVADCHDDIHLTLWAQFAGLVVCPGAAIDFSTGIAQNDVHVHRRGSPARTPSLP